MVRCYRFGQICKQERIKYFTHKVKPSDTVVYGNGPSVFEMFCKVELFPLAGQNSMRTRDASRRQPSEHSPGGAEPE